MAGYGANSDYIYRFGFKSRSGDRLPVPGWTGYRDETRITSYFRFDIGRSASGLEDPQSKTGACFKPPVEAQTGLENPIAAIIQRSPGSVQGFPFEY
jgi:hypothetical protein